MNWPRLVLLILCLVTLGFGILFVLALPGIGIAINDSVAIQLPENEIGGEMHMQINHGVMNVLLDSMLLPLIPLLLWIIVSLPVIIVLSRKKKDIEQAAPSNP